MVSGPDIVAACNMSESLARAGIVVTSLALGQALIQPAKIQTIVGEKLSIVMTVDK